MRNCEFCMEIWEFISQFCQDNLTWILILGQALTLIIAFVAFRKVTVLQRRERRETSGSTNVTNGALNLEEADKLEKPDGLHESVEQTGKERQNQEINVKIEVANVKITKDDYGPKTPQLIVEQIHLDRNDREKRVTKNQKENEEIQQGDEKPDLFTTSSGRVFCEEELRRQIR